MNQPVSPLPGRGSTLIIFDLDGCSEIVNRPQALHELVAKIVADQNLTVRPHTLLDVWESGQQGPSTSFTPLEESHVRSHVPPPKPADEFVRVETWPDQNNHVNGEVQVCNYSKNNSQLPYNILHRLRVELKAQSGSLTVMQRGPGCPQRILEGPLQFGFADEASRPHKARPLVEA